jgi:predicted adenine nucleotide alpha hydrolase (AANH) superfamily ATPase
MDCKVFGTTLTMGRQKKAAIINPIGKAVGGQLGLGFYEEDWKRKGRYEKRNALIKEKNIYQQNYCGCIYSLRSRK